MSQIAMQFSHRGDAAFDALASKFPNAKRWRLLFEEKLASDRFAEIHDAMRAYLSVVIGAKKTLDESAVCEGLLENRGKLPNYTPGGMLAPKREHTLEFNRLHRAVAAAFGDYPIEGHVDGIDLPINVRMVYGQSDAMRLRAPFSSSKLHSDVWAGVPSDGVVIVLPVLGDIENIYIDCAEMPRELELSAMRAMNDYDEGRELPVSKTYEGTMKHGHLYVADVRLLHQTIRRKQAGVRISVDLRFRYNDPGYRALTPKIEAGGPDSIDTRTPYGEWLRVGTNKLMVFEETMEEARAGKKVVSSSPVNTAAYDLISVTK